MLKLRNSRKLRGQSGLEAMLVAATLIVLLTFVYTHGYNHQGETVVFDSISQTLNKGVNYLNTQGAVLTGGAYTPLAQLKDKYPTVTARVNGYSIQDLGGGVYRVYVRLAVSNAPSGEVTQALSQYLAQALASQGYVTSVSPLEVKTKHFTVQIVFLTS